jgi:hypothetical protein
MRRRPDSVWLEYRQYGMIAGTGRPDLSASELLALANGIALTATDATRAERLVLLIRQGTDTPSAPAGSTR